MDDIASNPQIPEHPVGLSALLALPSSDDRMFDRLASRVFASQLVTSPTYGAYAGATEWNGWRSVPFLPVEAFKWPGITSIPDDDADAVFLSSATGGRQSRHCVVSTRLYDVLAATTFANSVGSGPFTFIAHLPTYAVNGTDSSLVHMVRSLMDRFGTSNSIFVEEGAELRSHIDAARRHGPRSAPILVFGTAFGLLDIVEDEPLHLPEGALVIETGGMKSRRREVERTSLHLTLARRFNIPTGSIRSEYGMCEMLSQYYTSGGNVFQSPPWVRFMVVDPDDPEIEVKQGEPGLLAVFDLANCHSVSPLLTSDLVRQVGSGFEVLGRSEGAELRGCNFLFEHLQ